MSDKPNHAMQRKLLYLFTRTPLHVGAGSSVGAIDQPIVRERHTGFPVIPPTTLKGVFADGWADDLVPNDKGEKVRVWFEKKEGQVAEHVSKEAAWLFGSDDANNSWAGALQFSEGKLLAFPIRSGKGSFAWITCPLMLRRAVRDGVLKAEHLPSFPSDKDADGKALFGKTGPLAIGDKLVLEEYTLTHAGELPNGLGIALQSLLDGDEVWREVTSRLVIVSDGMMSFFAASACEVAQHVRISDETGTAAVGALFNQENVPSETLFYSVLHCYRERGRGKKENELRPAKDAAKAFVRRVHDKPFQFGGDASTGLGFCTVEVEGGDELLQTDNQQPKPQANLSK
jgi:CRISPR-associated protein Cmr4